VIRIAAFLGHAKQDDRLADEDAALGLAGRSFLIHHEVAVMQRLFSLTTTAYAIILKQQF